MTKTSSIVVLLAVIGCGGPVSNGAPPGAPEVPRVPGMVQPRHGKPNLGDRAPGFTLKDARGNEVALSSLRGSPVLIEFGTSWCPFARAELAGLKQVADDYGPKGVKVLLVDVKEGEPEYREYAGRLPLSFPVLRDETGQVAASYAPEHAAPARPGRHTVVIAGNVIVDASGTIRFFTLVDSRHFDAKLANARAALDRLLAERSSL